ncbi:bifunctional DNA primase/polymerase-like protein [Kitasatospora sp. SolWspMP-SS2h]|uniref:bifunctional DNA primase/polymerase n=1 Tax=Kitasatospora sp. SolWspMP-SS2h TaxID=1305729 RepID=UPI000DBA21AE|nr:bifunctional DNA primase/polymerase [Kitasatospora sp. SolWspMP-SS2h]RAJ31228.1 bifunctional DNA primase/polymerase-like protein [Kitasatospora sp. SolWspMP-SS2h]
MRPPRRELLPERVGRWWPGRRSRSLALAAALRAAEGCGWPVLPGARALRGAPGPCSCADRSCAVPGGHPDDPPLEAATTDPRMVRWWWERRAPGAPVLAATGRALGAVSLPRPAGPWLLRHLDEIGVPYGPVLGTPGRFVLLTAPYTLPELGGLLAERPWVPGALRYHGPGGYLVLPPSRTGAGPVHWVRRPGPGRPWLPEVGTLLGGLITASAVALPQS